MGSLLPEQPIIKLNSLTGASFGRYALCLIISLAALAVYSDTLYHDFVWDTFFELQNPQIRDISHLPDIIFGRSMDWTGNKVIPLFAPFGGIIRMLQYGLFEIKPWGYHLTNILLHILTVIMVFLVGGALFDRFFNYKGTIFPAAAALLFAVHPVNTEAVSWASGINELNMTLLCLTSLYLYLRADATPIVSGIAYFSALLFKVTALFWFPVFFLFELSLRKQAGAYQPDNLTFFKYVFKKYVPYLVAVIVYLVMRTYAMGGFVPQKGGTALGPWQAFINVFPLFAKYLELLLWPGDLKALYVFHPYSSFSEGVVLAALIASGLYLSLVLWSFKKKPALFFGLLCIALPLVPCLTLPALGYSYYVFAERYLYLSSAGYALCAAIVMKIIYEKNILKKMTAGLLVSFFCAAVVVFSFMTTERVRVWSNAYTLWSDTVIKSPDSPIAHNNLGAEYLQKGDPAAAMKEFETAVFLDKDYADAQMNLINLKRRGARQ
ncbi:MAG: hypothetical protein HZB33_10710 [Nitrospirae bacterium]|nr:hypothetical protein [Nitrospirota bacterium]